MQKSSGRTPAPRRMRSIAFSGLALALVSGLVACGSDDVADDPAVQAADDPVVETTDARAVETTDGSSAEITEAPTSPTTAPAVEATAAPAEPDEVTLHIQGAENGTFTAFWYGLDAGIYAKHGIDLTIQPGTAAQVAIDAVARGDADFSSTGFGAVLLNRLAGNPIVGLAEFVRGGNQGLLVGADSGITSWSDLAGKSVMMATGNSQEPLYSTALESAGVDRASVEELAVAQQAFTQLFAAGDADAMLTVFPYAQPPVEKTRDVERLPFEEAGVVVPGFFLISTEDYLAANPDIARRFVDATLESWATAFANPEEAVAAMLEKNPALNPDDAMATFRAWAGDGCGVNDNGSWYGDFTREELEAGLETLVASGIIEEGAVDLDEAFPRTVVDAIPVENRIDCSTVAAGS